MTQASHTKWMALIATTAITCLGITVGCTTFVPDLDNGSSNFTAQVGSDGTPVAVVMNVDYSDWNVDKVVVEVTGPNGFRATLALTRETDLVGEIPGLPLDAELSVRECWWKYHHPRADGCTSAYTVRTPSAAQLLPPPGNNGGGGNHNGNGNGNPNGGNGNGGADPCDKHVSINAPVLVGGDVTFGAPYLWSASADSGTVQWATLTFYSNVDATPISITHITSISFPYAQTLTIGNDEAQDVGPAKALLEVKYAGCNTTETSEFSFNIVAPDSGSGDLEFALSDNTMFYGMEFPHEVNLVVTFPVSVASASLHIVYPMDPHDPSNPPHTVDVSLVTPDGGTTWHVPSYLLSAPPGFGHAGIITFQVTGGSYSGSAEGYIQ